MSSASGGRLAEGNGSGDQRFRTKKPDRRRHEQDTGKLVSAIAKKEEELRALQARADREQLQSHLKQCRAQKEETIASRRNLDQELHTLTQDIANKRDGVAKIQGTLKYKQEDKINEAIKRLEYQLQVNNYKINEERKIVKEIDNLNRSKRSLKEYLTRKAELDRMREKQQEMREKRESLFKSVTDIKSFEEKSKREFSEVQEQIAVMKGDIDQLYQQKRALVTEFKQTSSEYFKQRDEAKRMVQKQKDAKRALQEGTNCEGERCMRNVSPYSEERGLCSTLLAYLERFRVPGPTSCSSVVYSSVETGAEFPAPLMTPNSEGHTPVSPVEDDGRTIVYRKEEAELAGIASGGKKHRTKKEKRKIQKKAIAHTPEVYHQFCKLGLRPPSLLVEVPVSVEQLKMKRKYLEKLSVANATPVRDETGFPLYSVPENLTDCVAGAACESECLNLGFSATDLPTELPWSLHMPANDHGAVECTWPRSNLSPVSAQTSRLETNGCLYRSSAQCPDTCGTASWCRATAGSDVQQLSPSEAEGGKGRPAPQKSLPRLSTALSGASSVQNFDTVLGQVLETSARTMAEGRLHNKLFELVIQEHQPVLAINGVPMDAVESVGPSCPESLLPSQRPSESAGISTSATCV